MNISYYAQKFYFTPKSPKGDFPASQQCMRKQQKG